MSEKEELAARVVLSLIRSTGSYLEVEDHEIDLSEVQSRPFAIDEVGERLTSAQKYFILERLNFSGLVSLENLPPSAVFMIEKIEMISIEDSIDILEKAIEEFESDVNVNRDDYDLFVKLVGMAPEKRTSPIAAKLGSALEKEYGKVTQLSVPNSDSKSESQPQYSPHTITDWDLQVRLEAALIAYWSPYPEVRSICEPFDDPNIPCETIRVYILGIIWTGIGSFINQFFSERQPSISLSTSVVQIFLYPCGWLLAYILPKWKFKIWRYTFDLNPGPWTFKEQMLATIFFSVSGSVSYVSYNIHVQKVKRFYNNHWVTFGYETLLILSTNFMGFGFAGIMRKFAVYPTRAIWPTLFPTLALNKALMNPEKKEVINGWKISRYSFFFIVFAASFLYFWIPNYLFTALSTFSWLAWTKSDNFNLAAITGSQSGLGLNPIPSFDWNVLNYNAALNIPFYSQVNQYIGSIIAFFCIVGVYYSNYYWSAYLPINSSSLFTNTGEYYSVTEIVNSRSQFDNEKYQEIGPAYYSAANLVTYGSFFAMYPFAFVYEFATNYKSYLFSGKALYLSFRNMRRSNYEGFDDPHCRMMSRYAEVPDWVFGCVLIISIVLAILCVELFPTLTPVWGIFFALGMNFVFLIPLTTIVSTTGFSFGLNVLVELIIGYALPGNPMALIFIKALGYNIDGQASDYVSDQKMGHYLKIPPRAMFRCQILSVFVNSFIGLAVMNFEISHIKNYCMPHQAQKFTCPLSSVYYSASVIWGVLGPKKVFNGLYPLLKWCFLIGAVAAIVCAVIKLYGPKKYLNTFQPTLIIGGMLIYAPYNLSYYTGGLYLSWASMYYVKKHYSAFWEKYNYLFSGAMSAGVAFSGIIIFFAVQYHEKDVNWWGNDVNNYGVDGGNGRQSLLNATVNAPDGYFGLRKGHYP